jgi:putative ABC transport system substrate-binding protein
VIFTHSNHGARAAARATRTIPVVVGAAAEETMIEMAGGLARPTGNVTCLTLVSHDQHAKCLELLKEAHGEAARFAILVDRQGDFGGYLGALSSALAPLKVDLIRVDTDEVDLDAAFATMTAARVHGVLITATPAFNTPTMHRKASKLALEARIPLVATFEEFAREGGLLALSTNYRALIRRSATYVDKILKGAKPGELPIERPTVFTLTINLNAAKSLGITVPPSLLARADEVIE